MCGPSKKVAFFSSTLSGPELSERLSGLDMAAKCKYFCLRDDQRTKYGVGSEYFDLYVATDRQAFERLLDERLDTRGDGTPVVWSTFHEMGATLDLGTTGTAGQWLQKIVRGSLDGRQD